MRKILFALCGTMVLVLLALSPASAGGGPDLVYRSDLVCDPLFEDSGFAVILNSNGDLHVTLETHPPALNRDIFCQITCNNTPFDNPPGPFTLPQPPPTPRGIFCGNTGSTGKVSFRVNGAGNVGSGRVCREPSVQVRDLTIDCTSGYPTPQ